MNKEEFAQSIRTKYPAYKDVDTDTLVTKITQKYPVYKSQITDLVAETGILNKIGDKLEQAGKNVVEAVKDPLTEIPKRLNNVTPTPQDTAILSGRNTTATPEEKNQAKESLSSFALSFDGGTQPQKLREIADESFRNAISKRPSFEGLENISQKIKDFFSKDVDEKASTILKETNTNKLDEYVQIAKDAITDPRKLTPFEVVGDKMADAARQLQGQIKSFSTQKKEIISKAKNGLDDFTKETGKIILDLRRGLKDSKIGNQVMSKLKSVKTKIDADNVIDDIQDMLYKGNKDLTIPQGSSEDKFLRGVLGKYNSSLKSSLPNSYGNLNAKISNRIKIVDQLNRALGDVVDGTSTKGAGLIKQFFSPSGRKSKEIFDYIKSNTGIDLAQDATLARFTMELFDDARAKSLLEGIPTSAGGLIQTGINALVERTGTGKKVLDSLKESTLNKARQLTK